MQNKPHIFVAKGNGLFVHVPKSFTDAEIEHWANKERPLGDAVWKVAPKTVRHPENRVCCDGHPDSWHVALTIEGKEFNSGEATEVGSSTELDKDMADIDRMLDALNAAKGVIKRPTDAIIAADPEQFGYEQLFGIKPAWSEKLKNFVNEIMCGPSELSRWEREMILANVAVCDGGTWLVALHRGVAIELCGSKEKFLVESMKPKSTALGAFIVAVSQGMYIPPIFTKKMKEEGWTDEGIHDAVLVVGVAKLLNTYVEGLAAKIPTKPSDPIISTLAKQIAEKGYV